MASYYFQGHFQIPLVQPLIWTHCQPILQTEMSLPERSPIRVSDLPSSLLDSLYVPRVPSSPIAKVYEESNRGCTPDLFPSPEVQEPTLNPEAAESSESAKLSQDIAGLLRRYQDDIESRGYFEQVLSSPVGLAPPPTTRIWGIDFHAVDMEESLDYLEQVIRTGTPSYAITANLNYAMLCEKNPRLAAFTRQAALTLCDGMPILWRSQLNTVKLPERVAGADLIFRLTERCAQRKRSVYFYGAAEGVAEKAAAALKKLYPNLIIAGIQCPPFRACSPEDIRVQIERIKKTKPDVLYLALGQPKGEYWIEDHLNELGVPLTIQLGASFDFAAGNSKRAPKIWQKLGLEWLHRTINDPKRLAPRYLANLFFLMKITRRELIEMLS